MQRHAIGMGFTSSGLSQADQPDGVQERPYNHNGQAHLHKSFCDEMSNKAKLYVRHYQAGKQDATQTIDASVPRTKTDLLAVTA